MKTQDNGSSTHSTVDRTNTLHQNSVISGQDKEGHLTQRPHVSFVSSQTAILTSDLRFSHLA